MHDSGRLALGLAEDNVNKVLGGWDDLDALKIIDRHFGYLYE